MPFPFLRNQPSQCVRVRRTKSVFEQIPMYHLPIAVNSPNHLSGDWGPNRSDERLLCIWFYCVTRGFALKPNLHSQLKIAVAPHASFDIGLSVRYSEQRNGAFPLCGERGGEIPRTNHLYAGFAFILTPFAPRLDVFCSVWKQFVCRSPGLRGLGVVGGRLWWIL